AASIRGRRALRRPRSDEPDAVRRFIFARSRQAARLLLIARGPSELDLVCRVIEADSDCCSSSPDRSGTELSDSPFAGLFRCERDGEWEWTAAVRKRKFLD